MPWIQKVNAKNVADCVKQDGRKENEVLTIYNQLPKLTDREKLYWDFVEISEEEATQYRATRNKIREFYKAKTTEWTDSFPQSKTGWEDEKGTVYELKEVPFLPIVHDPVKGFCLSVEQSSINKETVLVVAKEQIGEITK